MAQGTESLGCHFALSRNRPHSEFSTKRRQTRKEIFLSRMEQIL
ncbi:TPA: hypothetical protein ACTW9B_005383, partial [Klebsiella michiganensis]